MNKRFFCLTAVLIFPLFFGGKLFAAEKTVATARNPDFVIIDSWLVGCVSGFFKTKEKRFKSAWKEANHRAASDAKIWGGLFISDTNHSGMYRFGEVVSRFTYQVPQTIGGFGTAQFYNTIGKVNRVDYAFGATSVNMSVSWPGVTLGSYILARKTIEAVPDNKLFQHEYGHYLQSKRMGLAYFVRVGLPAIMSKGDHDTHPVEIDCNREGFLYFNKYIPDFQDDSLKADNKGWNFYYNPFPAAIGTATPYKDTVIQHLDYSDSVKVQELQVFKVRATFIDYASWIVIPTPVLVGVLHARKYNKEKLKEEAPLAELKIDK